MTTWQPPIPSGALYSKAAIDLGSGLALLAWCYDNVERDGSVQVLLEQAAADIGKPYGTVRDWWKDMKGSETTPSPFFSKVVPQGRKGWRATFKPRWIDWRINERNYPERRDFGDEETNTAENPAVLPEKTESDDDRPNGAGLSDFSSQFDRRDSSDQQSRNKVLMTPGQADQESSPSFQPLQAAVKPDRAMVMMMADKGIKSAKVLNEIASMGLDLVTVEQSIDNLLADKTTIGAIVELLKTAPPESGKPYPRARAPAGRVTVDLPPVPERPSKAVLSATERRQMLEQHRNGSS